MTHKVTVRVDPELSAEIQYYLTTMKEHGSSDTTFWEEFWRTTNRGTLERNHNLTVTAVFPDGKNMDIKLYFDDSQYSPCVEGILFDENSCELSSTADNDEFFGCWELEDSNGTLYQADIIACRQHLVIITGEDVLPEPLLIENYDDRFVETYNRIIEAWHDSYIEWHRFVGNELSKAGYIFKFLSCTILDEFAQSCDYIDPEK